MERCLPAAARPRDEADAIGTVEGSRLGNWIDALEEGRLPPNYRGTCPGFPSSEL